MPRSKAHTYYLLWQWSIRKVNGGFQIKLEIDGNDERVTASNMELYTSPASSKAEQMNWRIEAQEQHGKNVYTYEVSLHFRP